MADDFETISDGVNLTVVIAMQTLSSSVSALSRETWEGALLPQLHLQSTMILALLNHQQRRLAQKDISLHDGRDG